MRIGLDGFPLLTPLTGVGHYTFELARALAMLAPSNEFELVAPSAFPSLTTSREGVAMTMETSVVCWRAWRVDATDQGWATSGTMLEHFPVKWTPVNRRKCDKQNTRALSFDSNRVESALSCATTCHQLISAVMSLPHVSIRIERQGVVRARPDRNDVVRQRRHDPLCRAHRECNAAGARLPGVIQAPRVDTPVEQQCTTDSAPAACTAVTTSRIRLSASCWSTTAGSLLE